MGSGKSTIGKSVAEALGIPFRDTDTIVEELEGM
jgi:shikimate kinase